MESIQDHSISCPYCGESIDIMVDCSIEHQQYIEDCQVCCRPIQLSVSVDGENLVSVSAHHEND